MKALKQHLANNKIWVDGEILQRIKKAVKEYNKEWLAQKQKEIEILDEAGQQLSDNYENLKGKVEAFREKAKQIQINLAESFKLVHVQFMQNEISGDEWELYEQWYNFFLTKIRYLVDVFVSEAERETIYERESCKIGEYTIKKEK